MDELFQRTVAMTKAHAKQSVSTFRRTQKQSVPVERVWLLWVGDAVLGVYRSIDKLSDDVQAIQRDSVNTWTLVADMRWRSSTGTMMRAESRVIG